MSDEVMEAEDVEFEEAGGFKKFVLAKEMDDPVNDVVFVRMYELRQAMGGPEEGGWWFMTGEAVGPNVVCGADEVEHIIELLKKKHPDEEGANVYSVIYRGGCFGAQFGDEPQPDYFPTETPHYE